MRSFGPTHARFDHHPEPVGDHPNLGIMYGAVISKVDPDYPLLRTCLAEVFRDSGTVTLKRHEPHFATFATQRPLRLLDLADSDWLTLAGGNTAIMSGPRSASRAWARATYAAYPELDGILYQPSNTPPARAVALFERAARAIPNHPSFHQPLAARGLRPAIETFARDLGMVVEG
jgi:hypothetical protein